MSSCKGDGEYTNRILRRRSVIEYEILFSKLKRKTWYIAFSTHFDFCALIVNLILENF